MNRFIVGLGGPPRQYEINGVKYIVSSSFQTAKIKEHQGIVERFGKALKSQFAHLYRQCGFDILAVDKACSTAGKENELHNALAGLKSCIYRGICDGVGEMPDMRGCGDV